MLQRSQTVYTHARLVVFLPLIQMEMTRHLLGAGPCHGQRRFAVLAFSPARTRRGGYWHN